MKHLNASSLRSHDIFGCRWWLSLLYYFAVVYDFLILKGNIINSRIEIYIFTFLKFQLLLYIEFLVQRGILLRLKYFWLEFSIFNLNVIQSWVNNGSLKFSEWSSYKYNLVSRGIIRLICIFRSAILIIFLSHHRSF